MSKKKTQEEFEKEVYDLVGNEYTVEGIYQGTHEKIKFRHNLCNNIWETQPHNFLQGATCFYCALEKKNDNKRKPHEQFVDEVFKLVNNEYTILSKYTGAQRKILMKHNICGCEYEVKPSLFLLGRRCPKCAESKGEQRIRHLLEYANIEFDKLLGLGYGNLSYDFYLPTYNLLIEYQGEFHDGTAYQQTNEEFKIQLEHDKRKKQYATDNNINLLEIWYWDFDNIEGILKDKLLIN